MRLLAVLIAACTAGAAGAEVALRVHLDPPETPFHRVGHLRVVLETPEPLELALPELAVELDGLELREAAASELVRGGRRIQEQRYILEPLHPRDYVLPGLEVQWEGGAVSTPPLLFRVRELSEEEAAAALEFVDIVTAGALLEEHRDAPWGPIAAAALLLAVLGAVAAYVLWKKSQPAPVAPPPAPWELAYRRLRELQARELPAQGKFERYYVDLSAILRFYIEDRFHVHAPEQTTQEFLETAAQSRVFSEEHQQLLADFLRLADRVKFARHVPGPEDMEQSYLAALQFVRETEPRPEPEAAQALQEAAT